MGGDVKDALNKLIAAMHRDAGEEILMESRQTIRLRKAGAPEATLVPQELSTDQLQSLLREVTPAEANWIFAREGEAVFAYGAPTGAVSIRVQRQGDRMAVGIRPRPPPPSRTNTRIPAVPPATTPAGGVATGGPQVMPLTTPAPAAAFGVSPKSSPSLAVPEAVAPVLGFGAPTKSSPAMVAVRDTAPANPEAPHPTGSGANDPSAAPATERRRLSTLVPGYHGIHKPTFPSGSEPPLQAPPPLPGVPLRHRIDPILMTVFQLGGSDLHLTAGMEARMRRQGDIVVVPGCETPFSSDAIRDMLMEVASPAVREVFQAKNDADYAYDVPGMARFRVNAFRDRRGVGGVLRTIPATIQTLEQLGMPPVVKELCSLPKGLVVVTGPTGCGKSTTLAAMIDHINRSRNAHIITIEDPIEFVHEARNSLIHQREVQTHTESFATALRASLREDPDIVMVGELRDLETVSIAIETAETGHLVLATLHTNTAASTVDRLIDQFPTDRQNQIRVMLSDSLRGVITQTLCRRVAGGRVPALEILLGTPAVASLIREAKTFQISSTMQTNRAMGMATLNDALLQLVKDRVIEPAEAYLRAVNRTEMRTVLEAAGYRLT
jgi:twitching motility protein PilT